MKYYIIAGEASGDLHASELIKELKNKDLDAEFRFLGGDKMAEAAGDCGTLVKHYKEMAYMGFVPVLLHLRTILNNMKNAKADIVGWMPHVVILVDYPGFNLSIAKYVKENTGIPVYYYISPKIWAWKEYRIKDIKKYVDKMFSILPFEVPFYEQKHKYPIHYVGNPTADEVRHFKSKYTETLEEFCSRYDLNSKPIIALLAGSRKQEIKDNLPSMIEATRRYRDYQVVLAGAPGISMEYYRSFIGGEIEEDGLLRGGCVKVINNETYALLTHSTAALVTSGTATLETALFDVPQVVCYETPLPWLFGWGRRHVIKVPYISLVNLIAGKEVVSELVADTFTVQNIAAKLSAILPGCQHRKAMLEDYKQVWDALGEKPAPEEASKIITESLQVL